jgi:hypothetical protein
MVARRAIFCPKSNVLNFNVMKEHLNLEIYRGRVVVLLEISVHNCLQFEEK